MSSLIVFPTRSNAFSAYRPSSNAHLDILTPTSKGIHRDRSLSSEPVQKGPRVIKLKLRSQAAGPSESQLLKDVIGSIAPILAGKPTNASFHHISSSIRRLISHATPPPDAERIYDCVKQELRDSIEVNAKEWRRLIMARERNWLPTLVDGWKAWEARVGLLSSVFVYLDRIYANQANGRDSIRELSIDIFRKAVWQDEIIFRKTRDDMINWAANEREEAKTDANIRSIVVALVGLSKLLSTFDTISFPYLEAATEHFSELASSNVAKIESGGMSSTTYVAWTLEKVDEERERALACLDSQAATDVVDKVRVECGAKQSQRIVLHAIEEAMNNLDDSALAQLYKLSVDAEFFQLFSKTLRVHLSDRLRKIISDPAHDSQMIESTLTLKRFVEKAMTGLFKEPIAVQADDTAPTTSIEKSEGKEEGLASRRRRIELEDTIRIGFKAGMDSRQNAPAEWIAKHLDVAMRRGQGSGTEAEFNKLLEEIIALIGFTRDKDVFKAFYSTQLAKRLLLSKSASDDMERNMIVKLQNEMGEEFTSGDVMMKDLSLSETLAKNYAQAQGKNPEEYKDAGNFVASVLTESAWPNYPLLKDGWAFKLTPELQASVDAFTAWYATQHKNRQLSWRWQLATVTLSARFASGKYEVDVSLFQAVVLLNFNEDDTLDFEEIKARTGIESSELVRTVQSLALGRKGTRVLLKKPTSREVSPTDIFAWNKAFTSDRIRFKINQIQQDMSAEEDRQTNEQIAIDRVSVLEATIVRIMKARKKMTLQLLIDAVVTDVNKRFPPDVKEIKKRVENLIEREFLMRDEEDRNLLHYLA